MAGDMAGGMDGMIHGGLPEGLAVSAGGYTMKPAFTGLVAGETSIFSFRILAADGTPLTRYTLLHERELHLIVVRRDPTHYQHLHPSLGPDGTWSLPLNLPGAGVYKAFATFEPADGPMPMPMTLAVDLFVAGDYQPVPVPAPTATATVDGYGVTMTGSLAAAGESELTFTVTRGGGPVTDLESYLGAFGHLVALRVGDLAYLHVHPRSDPGDSETGGPEIAFHTEVPSEGAYRLFLDFQHDGVVRTAEFTAVTADAGGGGHHH